MPQRLLESPLLRTPRPWWLPVISLCLSLYGIVFQGWNFQPIVFMFWFEVILLLAFAHFRMVFALDGQPWTATIFKKIGMLVFGGVMSIAMIMLTVTFTINAFDGGMSTNGFEKIPIQVRLLLLGYVAGLVIHYFGNERYKTANPMTEMMSAFIHVLVLLALLMPITMHLLPKYPKLNQAMWAGVAVVVVKFIVDTAFSRAGQKIASAIRS